MSAIAIMSNKVSDSIVGVRALNEALNVMISQVLTGVKISAENYVPKVNTNKSTSQDKKQIAAKTAVVDSNQTVGVDSKLDDMLAEIAESKTSVTKKELVEFIEIIKSMQTEVVAKDFVKKYFEIEMDDETSGTVSKYVLETIIPCIGQVEDSMVIELFIANIISVINEFLSNSLSEDEKTKLTATVLDSDREKVRLIIKEFSDSIAPKLEEAITAGKYDLFISVLAETTARNSESPTDDDPIEIINAEEVDVVDQETKTQDTPLTRVLDIVRETGYNADAYLRSIDNLLNVIVSDNNGIIYPDKSFILDIYGEVYGIKSKWFPVPIFGGGDDNSIINYDNYDCMMTSSEIIKAYVIGSNVEDLSKYTMYTPEHKQASKLFNFKSLSMAPVKVRTELSRKIISMLNGESASVQNDIRLKKKYELVKYLNKKEFTLLSEDIYDKQIVLQTVNDVTTLLVQ